MGIGSFLNYIDHWRARLHFRYWRARHASPLQSLAGARLTRKGNGSLLNYIDTWAGEACLAPTFCVFSLVSPTSYFVLELPNLCNVVAVEPYTAFDSTAVGGKYLLVPVIQTCAHVGLHPELYYVGVWVNAAYLYELQICGG